ncbi:MAG: type II secretion system F family protein [Patescibacteria group bacterium]
MKYKYQAKTREGELQVGFIEAGTKDSAASILASHNLFILTLEAAESIHWYDRLASYFSLVRRKDFVIFSRQLALLLNARLPLGDALRNLVQQTQNTTLKEAVTLVAEDINSGLSFSQALERQSSVFSEFFISLIRASEVTGNLAEAAAFLADYYEKELVITSKVKSALMYPIIVVFLFIGVSVLLITVVFPQIGPIFAQAKVDLPLFTRILLSSGDFLSRWWLALIISLVVIMATILDYARTKEGEAVFDELKIRLPIVGKIYTPLVITRISNNAAILLHGGVPVAQTLEIVSQTVDNAVYEELLRDISNAVRQGDTISKAMARQPDYFPTLVPQMLAVGEITGQVDEIFTRIATLYGRELDDTINNMTELIQPVLMVGLGLLTGLLFGSILIPLYKLVSTFQ